MISKFIEIRDEGTCIPALAIQTSHGEHEREAAAFFRRAGYGETSIILIHLSTGTAQSDPFNWLNRTMTLAHAWIEQHWSDLTSGQVVDVRVILKYTSKPAKGEIMS